jgi:hypothetical protein
MDGMIKDTPFNKAQDAFKDFLKKQSLPVDLLWLFCEDVISKRGEYLIRVPTITESERLAEECYELGRNRGFGVALHGFCLLDKRVCCYIQLPEDDLDSQRKLMSDIYVKYSVVDPIKKGRAVKNPILWSIRKWQNRSKNQASFIDDIPMKKTLLPIYEGKGV